MGKIFFIFYLFAKYRSKTVLFSKFVNHKIDAVIIISFVELVNISTIWMFFSIPLLTATSKGDLILGFVFLLLLNGLYFLRKKKFDKLSKWYENSQQITRNFTKFIALLYCFLSIILYFII